MSIALRASTDCELPIPFGLRPCFAHNPENPFCGGRLQYGLAAMQSTREKIARRNARTHVVPTVALARCSINLKAMINLSNLHLGELVLKPVDRSGLPSTKSIVSQGGDP
jgi:hypothetical protein